MQPLLQDLRYGLRQLGRAPGFAVTAVLTLALGIGATTAIFTLVYDVLLKPLPFAHSDQLVMMEEQVAEFRDIYPTLPMNANHFLTWQQQARTVQSMAVMNEGSVPLGGDGHPLQIDVVSATPGIFSVLDVAPQLGRAFVAQEVQPGREHVIVLMDNLWRAQFQSDPHIVGRTVTLNGFPYTVIGVMPRSFRLPFIQTIAGPNKDRSRPVEALIPLSFSKDQLEEAMGDFNYFGLARLKPGVSVAQASAEINSLQRTIMAGLSAEEKGTLSAVLTPFQAALVGDSRTPLLILLAAVAGLLLIGCVNITNLLLSRAVARRRQMAVAAALGASRAQMLRMALRETSLIAALGGALGILLASTLVPVMQHYLPPALNFRGQLHLDWVGAACALFLAIASTLLAGAVPAWLGSRTDPHDVLQAASRLVGENRSTRRLRSALVAFEVAVSVTLVLMTGLLTTSLVRILHIDRGFDGEHTLTAEVNLPSKSYDELSSRVSFYREVLERLHQLPGLEQAALVSQVPLGGDQWIDMIRLPGDARPPMQLPTEHFRFVSPGYFEAIHLPLLAGRTLNTADQGKHYALVSERTAQTFWPRKNPVGQTFSRGGMSKEQPFTVIGVVRDARTVSLAQPDPMMVYMPYWYRADSTAGLLVRTHQDPSAFADSIRKTIWSVDPGASVPLVRSLNGIVAESVANRRFEMNLLLVFAASALLLAGLGIYGVVTYSVVRRQQEIGLRLALGAQTRRIYLLVLRDGLAPVFVGAGVGIAAAFACARFAASLLFQVSPYDPAVAALAVSVLVAVGASACLLPAHRAAATDPMRTLRME